MPLIAAGIGGVASLAGSLIGNNTANNAQEAAAAATQKAVDAVNAVGAGPDLAKQIFLEQYKAAGILTPEVEQNINTKFQQIASPNANVTNAQNDVLNKLTQQSSSGLTPQDRLALAEIQTKTARDNTASQNSITQNLAQRGLTSAGTSGAEIAQRLMSQQAGAQDESMQGLKIGADSAAAALQALSAEGGQANAMNSQQFQQNQANANIANEQNRFNTQNQINNQQRNVATQNAAKQYNLGNTQQIANANTSQNNQEAQREVQAQQTMYQNAMQHAQGIANAYTGQGQQIAQAGKDKAGAETGIFGGIASTAAGVGNYLNNQNQYSQLMGVLSKNNNPLTGSNTTTGVDGNSEFPVYAWSGGQINSLPAGYNSGGNVEGEYSHGGRIDMRSGGQVPGTANVPGDSPLNDTVPAMLSPGEYVIPRSEMSQMNEETPASGGKELDYNYLKSLLDTHKNVHKSMKKMCGGGMAHYDQGGPIEADTAQSFAQALNAPYGIHPEQGQSPMGQNVPQNIDPKILQMLQQQAGQNGPIQGYDEGGEVVPGAMSTESGPQIPNQGGNYSPEVLQFLAKLKGSQAPQEMSGGMSMPNGQTTEGNLNPIPDPGMTYGEDMSNVGPQIVAPTGKQNAMQQLDAQLQKPKEQPGRELAEEEHSPNNEQEAQPKTDNEVQKEVPSDSKKETPDYLGAMKAAMGASNMNSLNANLLKAYQQTLGAAGRRAPDYSLADSLEKSANTPVEQLGQGIKFQDQAQKMELNKEMDDPNSKISKLMQGIAVKYGVDPKVAEGTSASSLQKLVPSLANAASREDIAKIRNLASMGKADNSKNKDLNNFITKARAEGLKQQAASDELKKSTDMLEEGIKNPNAINDIASFYASAKAFNPKAIVRSQSVKLEQQAMGPWKNLENKINGLAGGKIRLNDTGVQQSMLDSINKLKEVADRDKQAYQDAVIHQGKNGYNLPDERVNEIFPTYQAPGQTQPGMPAQNSSGNSQPSSKPKTVTQGGHTYTLNEQTGKYE